MAATDELKVGRGRAEQIASRALARAEARPRQRARLVAAIVSGSAFAIVSVTGVGAIADQAVPGDSLYPVDRAYEAVARAVGRNADRTQETLQEAITLAQRGNRDRAAAHVATELGRFIVPDDPEQVDEPIVEATPTVEASSTGSPTLPVATEAASAAAAAETMTEPIEPDPAPVEEPASSAAGDSFLLALENALRATQAAAETDDESVVAQADEALRSVVKLASGATEELSGTVAQVAPNALSVPQSTTTTTVVRGNNGNAPGNSTSTTTTTSVPDDSEETLPGDGDTAGDESGGSQKGSGDAGEPGQTGSTPPGPIILPIP